ncbi:1-acyl-sn-glycerol-3-phosphate acyltransferase [Marinospirillum celere]|uniref:1-acyl-sn-glycerol-3-phosphate acyltransferase n=1 Tax=Marinospirillum celere TaxID=1122252 RepID=A0A1I1I9U0_9GAMM|nr:lysophospholipid acyltransferase family protein [Marinospirillum celere]SFC31058.1 1-acyl-sn-glycerol-3-phosphate acyltransferase [Marinospirillum celere]
MNKTTSQNTQERKARPIGSLIFYIGYFFALGFIGAPLALIAWPLPMRWRFQLLNLHSRFIIFWLGITCGIRYRFEGLDNLPDQPFVLVANHQSEWETLFLQTLKPPTCTVLKKELLKLPIFGWGLRLLKPIPLDRTQPAKMIRIVLKVGAERIQEGISVLIFPEGTRVAPGSYKAFSKSAAMIACRSGTPLIPVAHNAGEHWHSKSWIKYSGELSVRVGKPLTTEGRRADEVTQEAQAWIETQLAEISAIPRPAREEG